LRKRPTGATEATTCLVNNVDPPLAILQVSKIRLEVPVLESTDDLMNRGLGRITGYGARVRSVDNVGIAGHRDDFFGGPENLVMPSRTETYVVDSRQIVDPKDVSVPQPTNVPSLPLVADSEA
jgi:sortase (surface protein transpeptidase)